MKDIIVLENLGKRFKHQTMQRHTTLKDMVVKGQIFNIGRSRGYMEALKDISFSVPEGTVLGIIGPNGAGKTTLLRLLAGIYRPTSGRVTILGRISALLSLGLGFHPEFSGRENLMISGLSVGLSRKKIIEISDDIIQFAELEDFIDEPMRTYSSGMYMRLAFSVAINVNSDILLIDEILAVGDAGFAEKSRARMDEFKQNGKTILFATHDLLTVENWCTQALLLDGGQMCALGKADQVVAQYREKTGVTASVHTPID
jgi:lipopolysaccharide transport system ATP-binding protein